jgi:hypothetical protein
MLEVIIGKDSLLMIHTLACGRPDAATANDQTHVFLRPDMMSISTVFWTAPKLRQPSGMRLRLL